ncbi:MBL fold metallo-hydrolase [Patulibacter americanus]|uniref:MBL fold metallo-hydrolase n=1 Tax=Patulibacter americanus TaxID=588672 RepID=UPI0003B6C042|nr:MBL fold metallo-hydrolase [Patulibacter americanus]
MAATSDDAFLAPAAAGLHRVELSAANEMGTVNAWIIDDDPLTLVDAGTRTPGAVERLEAGFRAAGRRLEDVGLVVLTHHHTDHLGLAAEVVRRSGAEVAALAPIAPYLGDFPAEAARDRAYMAGVLRRHGWDDATVTTNVDGWARFHRVAEPCAVTVPLTAGARLTLRDRTLEVLHRPGHSESDVLLVDAQRRLAFGGDHLLGAVPSVPVRDRPLPGGDGEVPPDPPGDDIAAMVRYRDSLRATAALGLDVVLPGHGAAFGDHAGVVARHLARQERDAAGLLARMDAAPVTAAAIVRERWPRAPDGFAHVLMSGILGSLGLLRAEGRVAVLGAGRDGVVRFVAV